MKKRIERSGLVLKAKREGMEDINHNVPLTLLSALGFHFVLCFFDLGM